MTLVRYQESTESPSSAHPFEIEKVITRLAEAQGDWKILELKPEPATKKWDWDLWTYEYPVSEEYKRDEGRGWVMVGKAGELLG